MRARIFFGCFVGLLISIAVDCDGAPKNRRPLLSRISGSPEHQRMAETGQSIAQSRADRPESPASNRSVAAQGYRDQNIMVPVPSRTFSAEHTRAERMQGAVETPPKIVFSRLNASGSSPSHETKARPSNPKVGVEVRLPPTHTSGRTSE